MGRSIVATARSFAAAAGIFLIPLLLLAWASPARAAVRTLDGFGIHNGGTVAINGSVHAIAVQRQDGKIVIGGDFTLTGGNPMVARINIARINHDGTLDTSFEPPLLNGAVHAVALQPDVVTPGSPDHVWIGGSFTNAGGPDRKGLARLSGADGSLEALDPVTATLTPVTVDALALLPSGSAILVGGEFREIKEGVTTRNLAGVSVTTGALDWTYAGGLNDDAGNVAVHAIQLSDDGAVVIGGEFAATWSANIARFSAQGAYDATFRPVSPNGVVRALAAQADGKILLGGDFSGGLLSRNYLARLNPDGTVDPFAPSFDTAAGSSVSSISVEPDGRILVGGDFTLGPAPGQRRNLARLKIDGTLSDTVFPAADAAIRALVRQGDGMILAGGDFAHIGVVARTSLARFYPHGALDDDLPQLINDNQLVNRFSLRPDGSTTVAGFFEQVLGGARFHIAKFRGDWSLDPGFAPNLTLGQGAFSLVPLPDGSLLMGGDFLTINGDFQSQLVQLDPAGVPGPDAFNTAVNGYLELFGWLNAVTLSVDGMIYAGGDNLTPSSYRFLSRIKSSGERDASFPTPDAGVDGAVTAMAIQTDGKLLVSTDTGRVLRLMPDGSPDPDWHGGTWLQLGAKINHLVLLPDGRVLVAGYPMYPGSVIDAATGTTIPVSRNVIRIDSHGDIDESFVIQTRYTRDASFDAIVLGVALQTDGSVIIYGVFDEIRDGYGAVINRDYVARITPDGRLDTSLDLGAFSFASGTPFNQVETVNLQPDGKFLLGGGFSDLNGRSKIARFSNGRSSEEISVSAAGDTVAWLRSGTSPQVWRVTFDRCDNLDAPDWKPLGEAHWVGGRWELGGLDLAQFGINANRYIRARGYAAGELGTLGSMVESVRLYNLKPQKITITVTADAKSKIYGQDDPPLTYTFTPALNSGDQFTGTLSRVAGTDVGTYAITLGTLALGSDYDLVYNGAGLTVAPAPLLITANNQTKTASFANPQLTAGFAGLALWDTPASLGGAPLLSTAVDVATPRGSYPIHAALGTIGSANYQYSFADGTFTVTGRPQSITFLPPPVKTYGDPAFAAGASADSGLAVSYVSSNPAVAVVVGGEVRIVGVGSTVLTASQGGDAFWDPAPNVAVTLAVTARPQIITFPQPAPKRYGDPPFAAGASASSGLAVSYASSNPAVAVVVGGEIRIAGVGSTVLTAYQGGDAFWEPAHNVAVTLTVTARPQSITFPQPAPRRYGDPPFAVGASATSGLAVSCASSNPAVAVVVGGEIRIAGVGNTVLTASQGGGAFWDPAPTVAVTLTVSKATLRLVADDKARAYLTPNPALTASYQGFVYGEGNSVLTGAPSLATAATLSSAAGSYPIVAGAGTLQCANYNLVPVDGTLTVYKSCQEITFPAIPERTFGDPPFEIVASACSGLALSFKSSDPGVARVDGNVITITGAGTAVITASQPGTGDLQTALERSQVFIVHRSGQEVSFSSPAQKVVGDPPFALVATATSGLPVHYLSSNPAVATVDGSTVTIVGAGTTVISALQEGDGNFLSALPVSRPLTVAQEGEAPQLSLSTLSSGARTANPVVNLMGRATDRSCIASLIVQGSDRGADAALFSSAVVLAVGDNNISVAARDGAGNLTTHTFIVTLDPLAPALAVTAPADNGVTGSAASQVTGTVTPGSSVTMAVNGTSPQVLVVTAGNFSGTGYLVEGVNTLELNAELDGRSSRIKRSVTFVPQAPALAVTEPAQDVRTEAESLTIAGETGTSGAGSVLVRLGEAVFTPEPAAGVFVQQVALALGENRITVQATTPDGVTITAHRNVVRIERISGDLDGSGSVDILDAARLLRISLGTEAADASALAHGDVAPLVNGVPQPDGLIDVGDILVLLRKIVGLVSF